MQFPIHPRLPWRRTVTASVQPPAGRETETPCLHPPLQRHEDRPNLWHILYRLPQSVLWEEQTLGLAHS